METSQFNKTTSIGQKGIMKLQETCEGLWDKQKNTHIRCGSPYVIDKLLENLRCSNPYCPCKVHSQIYTFARRNEIQELTYNTVVSIIDEWGIKNPLDILTYNYGEYGILCKGMSEEECLSIEKQLDIDLGLDEIADIVISTKNKKLLAKFTDSFSSFTELYDYLDTEGILGMIQKVQGFDISERITEMYKSVMAFNEDELKKVCKLVSEDNFEALYETLKNSGEGVLKDAIINSIETVDTSIVQLYRDFIENKELLLEYES